MSECLLIYEWFSSMTLPFLLENIQATLYVKVPWFERNSTAAIRLLSSCITPWGLKLFLLRKPKIEKISTIHWITCRVTFTTIYCLMGIILAPTIVSIFFMFIGIMKVHYVMVAEFAYYCNFCNLFTHEALRSKHVRAFQIELEFQSVGF